MGRAPGLARSSTTSDNGRLLGPARSAISAGAQAGTLMSGPGTLGAKAEAWPPAAARLECQRTSER